MIEKISEEIKKEIFELITIPGIEIEEIAKKVHLSSDQVMNILSDEFLKHNLNYGRRMCCRF